MISLYVGRESTIQMGFVTVLRMQNDSVLGRPAFPKEVHELD